MTFESVETSISDGRPLELYEIVVAGLVFRFTNGERAIVKDSEDFLPTRIVRESIEQTNKQITGQFQFIWGLNDSVSSEFLGLWVSGPPEDDAVVTIFKEHVGDGEFITFWIGKINNAAFSPTTCRMLLSNVGSFFTDKGPRLTWGGHCGHNFGDDLCGFILSAVTYTWTITVIDADGITITFDEDIDAPPFNVLAGFMVRGELRKGGFERRYITQDNVTSNQITLMYPLPGLEVGNSVTMIEGCPHNVTACNDRFNIIENYGGVPYTPNINPFERTLDKI